MIFHAFFSVLRSPPEARAARALFEQSRENSNQDAASGCVAVGHNFLLYYKRHHRTWKSIVTRLHIELALRRANICRFRVRLGLSFGYSVYLIISINMDANVAMCASARSFVPSLCVNALWISMDFSSEATTKSVSLSLLLFSVLNKWLHACWYQQAVRLCCVCWMRNRAPYGSTCQRSIKICSLVMDFGMTFCRFSSDFRFIQTIASCRLMKCFFSFVFVFFFFIPLNNTQKHFTWRLVHISAAPAVARHQRQWRRAGDRVALSRHLFRSLNRKVQLTETNTLSYSLFFS